MGRVAVAAGRTAKAQARLHGRQGRALRECRAAAAGQGKGGWTGNGVRDAFLKYFEGKGHIVKPPARLIPEDETVLLTMAGMLPYKPCFLGEREPPGPRVTSAQRCVRTGDLSNVGVTSRHLSFFEMLGAFSFGDYFKEGAIDMAYELAVSVYGLEPQSLWVSILQGDTEALELWKSRAGIPPERIQELGPEENFWAAGETGPCGPCSEMYYDFFPERGVQGADLANDDERFLEFYNLVFVESDRLGDGSMRPLEGKCIDTGLGLERLVQILQGAGTAFETDLISPLVNKAAEMSSKASFSPDDWRRLRVVADHTRAVTHVLGDGVAFSNVGRGYVARRLARRAVREARLAGLPEGSVSRLVPVAIELARAADPEVARRAEARAQGAMEQEETRFNRALSRGEKLLAKSLEEAKSSGQGTISGGRAFELYDAHGFPLELTREIASDEGVQVDEEEFERCMEEQRRRARRSAGPATKLREEYAAGEAAASAGQATAFDGYDVLQEEGKVAGLAWREEGKKGTVVLDRTPFYPEGGGQVADIGWILAPHKGFSARVVDVQEGPNGSEEHAIEVEEAGSGLSEGDSVTAIVDREARHRAACHHTATHLLNAALRKHFGEGVTQAGSLVARDRLRFDFTTPREVEKGDLEAVEKEVNRVIGECIPVSATELSFEDAKERGACYLPGEEYMEQVRVVHVAGESLELCGGTHVWNTNELAGFRLISDGAIAAGVTRVEGVAGPALADLAKSRDGAVKEACGELNCNPDDLPERVRSLSEARATAEKRAKSLAQRLAKAEGSSAASSAMPLGPVLFAAQEVDPEVGTESLRDAASAAADTMGGSAVTVVAVSDGTSGKASLAVAVGTRAQELGLHAGKIAADAAQEIGGGGGGKPGIAQAGGKHSDGIPAALSRARSFVESSLTQTEAAAN